MFELVPSQEMRTYFAEVGFVFTDFQKATLIWNMPGKTRKEILDALRELADCTEDEELKKQISERILFEERKLEAFQRCEQGEVVYVVEDQDGWEGVSFFAAYNLAVDYARAYSQKYDTKCQISKQKIMKDPEEQMVDPLASVLLDQQGEITNVWSQELPQEEERVDEYQPERFEQAFMEIPFAMETGTVVKNVISGEHGVLYKGKEKWLEYLERVRGQLTDFSDVQVIVYSLEESGQWTHQHINPMYLEKADFSVDRHDRKKKAWKDAMYSLGKNLYKESRGEEMEEQEIRQKSGAYAEICWEEWREEKLRRSAF